jgi:putative acetyltransferase
VASAILPAGTQSPGSRITEIQMRTMNETSSHHLIHLLHTGNGQIVGLKAIIRLFFLKQSKEMTTIITPERPDTPDAVMLIDELESHLAPFYPAASRHGYSVEKLIKQGVAFFVTRRNNTPAGCGGVQFFGTEYGELKRMFVRPQFRGTGLAKLMLEHLEAYALEHDVPLLRLETGIFQKEAIGLYEHMGYRACPNFGEYTNDPLSVFFEKKIM